MKWKKGDGAELGTRNSTNGFETSWNSQNIEALRKQKIRDDNGGVMTFDQTRQAIGNNN